MTSAKEYKARQSKKCRHFQDASRNKTCKAEVIYKDFSRRWPCHGDVGDDISACEKHEPFTLAEMEEQKLKRQESIRFLTEAFKVINEIEGGSGTITCPKCSGVLQWSRASYNGHVHGQCLTTVGCMSWMQ